MNTDTLKSVLKNRTQGKKTCGDILKTYPIGELFNHPTISAVLEFHPEKDTSELEYCVMRLGEIYRTPTLFYKCPGYEETSISWITCIENLFEKFNSARNHIRDVTQAMRIAITEQTRTFRTANTEDGCSLCKLCNMLCGPGTEKVLHVDHHIIPFKFILEQFCKESALDLTTVEVVDSLLADTELRQRWETHHAELATYQILCKSCNLTKGCKI